MSDAWILPRKAHLLLVWQKTVTAEVSLQEVCTHLLRATTSEADILRGFPFMRPAMRVQQEARTLPSRCTLIQSFAPQHWQTEFQVTAHFSPLVPTLVVLRFLTELEDSVDHERSVSTGLAPDWYRFWRSKELSAAHANTLFSYELWNHAAFVFILELRWDISSSTPTASVLNKDDRMDQRWNDTCQGNPEVLVQNPHCSFADHKLHMDYPAIGIRSGRITAKAMAPSACNIQ